jgi:transposase-like protein
MTRPKRKSPGAGHRYVMVWPPEQWAELVAAAARENVSVAEVIRRRCVR